MRRKSPILLVVLCVSALAGCKEEKSPVGALRASPAEIVLGFPHHVSWNLEIDMDEALDPGASPIVMVHLLDASGMVVRTFDHDLPQPWTPGGTQSYSIELYQSALAPPLDPGSYRLTAGIYDPELGRWALSVQGEEVAGPEYRVATVEATRGSETAPKFFFSPSWMATEAGTDVQVLGRRWLRGEGELRVAGQGGPGTVRLQLRIPPAEESIEDLVLDEGYDTVQLDVETTCGGEPQSLHGVGTHVVEVALGPGGEDADCEIKLAPHYQIVTRRTLGDRALALDVVSWRAD
jgi:hypothetical protein